jgi:hypothetical protein
VVVVPVATAVEPTVAVPVVTTVAVPVVTAVLVTVPLAPAVVVAVGAPPVVGLGVTVCAMAAAPNIILATPRVAAALNHLLLIAVFILLVLSLYFQSWGYWLAPVEKTLQTSLVAYVGMKP